MHIFIQQKKFLTCIEHVTDSNLKKIEEKDWTKNKVINLLYNYYIKHTFDII